LTASGHAERVAPNILSLEHWERLEAGELYATTSRLAHAALFTCLPAGAYYRRI
jgi:hypothetical protein